ncbi:DMT family transporter [Parabacteroides sp. 52]|uniref:DMT family transporter n=1 Tax=unclassified Parabacteroides TaxID=2649774 RepID=UPI0013D6B969|nr:MULTISPECIES: DMT family transporter [unclassified Parabacteroides]MDH6534906.1 drug/metabolite transporter (DMT)-like permease [Parabacteroides sp. PM5-20]NDV55716.1 DMT family transporter [Parabacteroides sp. 52]
MKTKAILACLLWGSAFAGAKIGFQYVDPIYLSGMRFTLAGLLLVPVMWVKKVHLAASLRHWRFMLRFAFLQTFLQYGLFFMGLDKVPGSTAAIIIGGGPLFVAIMAHLTLANDKMSTRKIIAIILGLSGVVFISLAKGGFTSDNPAFYPGVALLLCSNLIGGYTNIMVVKQNKHNISPIALTSFANFTGGIMLIIAALFIEKPEIKLYPPEFYIALLWLAFIPAAAFSIWYSLLQRPDVKVSELNMWKFIIPVSGCVLSWIFLADEKPDLPSVIGIIIITLALQTLQLPERYFTSLKRFFRIKNK